MKVKVKVKVSEGFRLYDSSSIKGARSRAVPPLYSLGCAYAAAGVEKGGTGRPLLRPLLYSVDNFASYIREHCFGLGNDGHMCVDLLWERASPCSVGPTSAFGKVPNYGMLIPQTQGW